MEPATKEGLKKHSDYCFCSRLFFSLLFWSVCMFAPQFLVGMFSNDPNLVMFAEWALRIYIASVCIFWYTNSVSADVYSIKPSRSFNIFGAAQKNRSAYTVNFYTAEYYNSRICRYLRRIIFHLFWKAEEYSKSFRGIFSGAYFRLLGRGVYRADVCSEV